jgi:hypothetical protein
MSFTPYKRYAIGINDGIIKPSKDYTLCSYSNLRKARAIGLLWDTESGTLGSKNGHARGIS